MTQSILHIKLDGAASALPWKYDFTRRGIVVLRTAIPREALAYFHAYVVMLMLVELPAVCGVEQLEAIQQLAAVRPADGSPPLIGIYQNDLHSQSRAELAAAGVDDLISRDDPERFLIWRVEMLLALSELRRFEQTREDVGHLARSTREQLHDLSQPLSAVQGRLQLLAARCGPNDPNATYFQDMARLILDVSKHVMEIQQLHRKYS